MPNTMQLLECCTIGMNKILYFEILKKTLLSSSELGYYMCMFKGLQTADIIEWLHS